MKRLITAMLAAAFGVAAHAADLTVSAAASLTNAFKDLAPLFEAANPGTKVLYNFGASGALLQQIDKGRAGRRVRQRRPGDDGPGAGARAWCRPRSGATSCRTRWS